MKNRVLSILLAFALLTMTGCAAKVPVSETVPQTTSPEVMTAQATEPAHSDDWYAIHTLTNLFAAVYFDGNADILKNYLADSFVGDVEVYTSPSPTAVPNVISLKGLEDIGELEVGSVCHPSVEFFTGVEGDSYSYLSLTVVKEESGWKVQAYGLEK